MLLLILPSSVGRVVHLLQSGRWEGSGVTPQRGHGRRIDRARVLIRCYRVRVKERRNLVGAGGLRHVAAVSLLLWACPGETPAGDKAEPGHEYERDQVDAPKAPTREPAAKPSSTSQNVHSPAAADSHEVAPVEPAPPRTKRPKPSADSREDAEKPADSPRMLIGSDIPEGDLKRALEGKPVESTAGEVLGAPLEPAPSTQGTLPKK